MITSLLTFFTKRKEQKRQAKIAQFLTNCCSDNYIHTGQILLFTDITLTELNELFRSGKYKKL